MKKVFIVFILLLVTLGMSAQTLDPKLLDLRKAETFPAGPDLVFVRSIYYDGAPLSVLLEYNGEAGAIIYGPYYEEDMILPDDVELGYVTFNVKDDDTITISNIILSNDLAVSGDATWDLGAKLVVESFRETTPPITSEKQIAQLRKEASSLKLDVSKAQREKTEALAEAESAKKALGVAEAELEVAVEREMPTNTLPLGFRSGKPLTGSWSVAAGSLRQTDVEQKFAKFSIPVIQNKTQTLFSYAGKVTAGGWVGYGLHFFASGNRINEFFGLGKSYLVWLTRDEKYYKTKKTYLQVYESYNDYHMVQMASVVIPEDIGSSVKSEVLCDRSDGKIVVYINGKKRLEYQVDRILQSGDKVAFRSLGGGLEITEFSVKVD